MNGYDTLQECLKQFSAVYEPISDQATRVKSAQVNFSRMYGHKFDAPLVKNMEMWKIEALTRAADFRKGEFVYTGVGFNCTAVNMYLQDLQDRICFDFLYDLEGYTNMRYGETVGDK